MTAADQIKAARALIEPLRNGIPTVPKDRQAFFGEPSYDAADTLLVKAGDTVAYLADLADAQAQQLEAQAVELAVEKSRGDNHWEMLKGIRHIAKTSGDLERIILWVDDAGSGYTATPEASLAEVCDERNAARAEADALAQETERLRGIIARMDAATPRADKTCDEPGITLSEAVQRRWPELRIGETP